MRDVRWMDNVKSLIFSTTPLVRRVIVYKVALLVHPDGIPFTDPEIQSAPLLLQ